MVLSWPLLFSSVAFDRDWLTHLWYLWHQSHSIRSDFFPSLFVHYSHAVFYPVFAFYGGTLYALGGTLSLLLGDRPLAAYILTYCAGFAAAYGGWYWLARMARLGRWRAQAPGFVFVTAACYLTIVYGRGAWQEFIAVSVIPLLAAAALSVLRSKRTRPLPAFALATAAAVFAGAHNITLLWGTTFLAVICAAVLVGVPQARRQLTRHGAVQFGALVVPAGLLSAWFLLPELAYESRTWIGSGYGQGSAGYWRNAVQGAMHFVRAGVLFSPWRVASGRGFPEGAFFFSLPVLVIAWIAVGGTILLRAHTRGPWARVLAILVAVTALALLMTTHAGLATALPGPYQVLQFSFRLENYVLLGLSGIVLAMLVLAEQSSGTSARLWTWALVPILAVSLIEAVVQSDSVPHRGNRSALLGSYLLPRLPGTPVFEDYFDVERTNYPGGQTPTVSFPPGSVVHDRISEVVHLAPGKLVTSNVAGGPELVDIAGARIVGVDTAGNDVLQIEGPPSGASANGGSQPAETLTVTAAHTLPVTLGRVLTMIAALALAAQLAFLALREPLSRIRRPGYAAGTVRMPRSH